jgi:hypothetical protein
VLARRFALFDSFDLDPFGLCAQLQLWQFDYFEQPRGRFGFGSLPHGSLGRDLVDHCSQIPHYGEQVAAIEQHQQPQPTKSGATTARLLTIHVPDLFPSRSHQHGGRQHDWNRDFHLDWFSGSS